MINKTRVKRIKNVIYTLIVLIFLAPAVVLLAVSARLLHRLSDLERTIYQGYPYQAQAAPPFGSYADNQSISESYSPYYDYDDEPLEISEPLEIPEIPGAETSTDIPEYSEETASRQPDAEEPDAGSWPAYGDIESPDTGIPKVESPDTGIPRKGWR